MHPNAKCWTITLKANFFVINMYLNIRIYIGMCYQMYVKKMLLKIKSVWVRYIKWTEINLPDCFILFLFYYTLFHSKNIKTQTGTRKIYFYPKRSFEYLFQPVLTFLFFFSIEYKIKSVFTFYYILHSTYAYMHFWTVGSCRFIFMKQVFTDVHNVY